MRKLKIFISIVVILFSFVYFLVFIQLTKEIRGLTNLFLNYAKKGEFTKAYQLTSKKFQRSNSLEDFKIFILENDFIDYKGLSLAKTYFVWKEKGQFKGKIKTKKGQSVPIQLNFEKREGAWKIVFIGTSKGVIGEREIKEVPKKDELGNLVQATMDLFVESIAKNDFSEFYESISESWKKQITKEEISSGFQNIINSGADLSFVRETNPVFTKEAFVDKYGILTIEGKYSKESRSLSFVLKYVFEGTEWKLFGIEIKINTIMNE